MQNDNGVGAVQNQACLTILVADDDATNRRVLRVILERAGHRVLQATTGDEAVAIYDSAAPDMVLMDAMMPGMDGYQATRLIKARGVDRFVPVIFITSQTDEESLARCVECGGDDFITKPFSQVLLKSKIDALSRVRTLYQDLRRHRDELAAHHGRIRYEHELAEQLFSNVASTRCVDDPNIRCMQAPAAIASGDFVLVARKPSGEQLVMFGDATGHGLSAAVVAVPVADIFMNRAREGVALEGIIAEINKVLKERVPIGIFLAACFVEIDYARRRIAVWNAGSPDVLITPLAPGPVRRIGSSHLPLGIVENVDQDFTPAVAPLDDVARIYVYSDGLIEATDAQDRMFGEERLISLLANTASDDAFDAVVTELKNFAGPDGAHDDVTLVEITCDPRVLGEAEAHEPAFVLRYDIGPALIKSGDPVDPVLRMLDALSSLDAHRVNIGMIVMELVNNAIDHGLLRMDVTDKNRQAGFDAYYAERDQRLHALAAGHIVMELRHVTAGSGGRMTIRVTDSGPGFSYDYRPEDLPDNDASSGRGVALVRSLCETVHYVGSGNTVEAVYAWT